MAKPEPLDPKETRQTLEEMFRYAVRIWQNHDYAAGTRMEASVAAARIATFLMSFPPPVGLEEEEEDSPEGKGFESDPE